MSVRDRVIETAPAQHPASPNPAAQHVSTRRPFRTDIQGLRAIAVGLVLLNHAGAPIAPGGFIGVDIFFVISGFLISGHLVESLQRTGRINFAHFYAARARRILPAAIATVLATAIASFIVVSPLRVTEILHDAIASALYVPNLLFAVRQTDYLAGTAPSPFQHFWSLGVEEQFYIVWPLLLLGAFLALRRSVRSLMVVVALVTVASLLASIFITVDDPSLAFFAPHTRAWEFGIGALVAAAAPLLARVPDVLARALTWVGLAGIAIATAGYSSATSYPGSAALLPVFGTALIIAFGARGRGGVDTLLALRPVQFLGAISYSLYLVHWPILVLVHERVGLGQPLSLPVGLLLVVASVPVAWLLFRFIETPFRTSRTTGATGATSATGATAATGARHGTRTVLVVSTATTVVLVGSLLAGGAAAARLPLTSDRVETQRAASEQPVGTAFVPANITPTLAAATRDTGEIYTDGCQQNLTGSAVLSCAYGAVDSTRTVALFGDSHAGRWFPALEEAAAALGFRLDTYTKSGCRSEETAAAWNSTGNPSCATWREDAVAELNANPPDVIVLANHLGPSPAKDAATQTADWTDGLGQLMDRLPASSRVITLADSPEFTSSPVLCLSSHLESAGTCSVPRADALNPAIRQAQHNAAAQHGAAVIDLADYFCDATTCPAIIGATLVYSDEHHLTATFSRTLGPALQERLTPLLATIE